jgi:hypothetical protein
MCKEDVRLARAASPGQVYTGNPAAVLTRALPGNAERYSLAASLSTTVGYTTPGSCVVYASIGGLLFPLIGLSADHPAGTVNLLDVGSAIQSEIWVKYLQAIDAGNVTIAETKWDQPQESI